MNDKTKIIVGLGIFVVLVLSPVWYTAVAGGNGGPRPVLDLPEGDDVKCVEDKAYMTAHHMELLDTWRDAVVREGEKRYTSEATGKEHEMSLTRTCMSCHVDREAFCKRCHDYANVEPYCWDCHLDKIGE